MKRAYASRDPQPTWPRPEAEAVIDAAFMAWPVIVYLRSIALPGLARLGVRHNLRLPL